MGIIIIPFLIIALVISLVSVVLIIRLLLKKQITIKEIFLGFFTSLLLFAVIVLVYKILGSAWALSTVFIIPIFMVFIPFGIYFLVNIFQNDKWKYISMVLLISVCFSGILASIFYEVFFNFFDYIGIHKTY